jgi:hypothetical protein
MNAYPKTTAMMRFVFLFFLFLLRLCASIKSLFLGLKSDCIRDAVCSRSDEALRTLYVRGIVTKPTMVSMKKGKNWPWSS